MPKLGVLKESHKVGFRADRDERQTGLRDLWGEMGIHQQRHGMPALLQGLTERQEGKHVAAAAQGGDHHFHGA
jgi:hypothetical protein